MTKHIRRVPELDTLSFVTRHGPTVGGFNYWNVKPTGYYGADCDIGRKLASEYLAFIGAHPTYGNATLLTCIVHDMIKQAKDGANWSGVQVGFLAGVNECAMVTAAMMAPQNRGEVSPRKRAGLPRPKPVPALVEERAAV